MTTVCSGADVFRFAFHMEDEDPAIVDADVACRPSTRRASSTPYRTAATSRSSAGDAPRIAGCDATCGSAEAPLLGAGRGGSSGEGAVAAYERLDDALGERRLDPRPGVADGDLDHRLRAPGGEPHDALAGELGRVAEQVDQNLVEPIAVAVHDDRRIDVDLEGDRPGVAAING